MKKKNYENKPFITKTKIGSVIVCLTLMIPIVFFCVFSFVDKDKELSKDENRMLKQRPAFSAYFRNKSKRWDNVISVF